MDATDALFSAAAADEFPKDPSCLRSFLFDRCKEWPSLMGLYQGITGPIQHYLGRSFKQQIKAAVQQGTLLQCIDEIYGEFHHETGYPGSGHWKWYQQHRAELARNVTGDGPVGPHSRVRLSGLVACPELNGAEGWVLEKPPQPGAGRLAVKIKTPPEAAARHPAGVWVKASNLEQLPAPAAVIVAGPGLYPAWALDSGPGLCCEGFDWRPPVPAQEAMSGPELQCDIPAALGIPLVLVQLAPQATRESDERTAVLLLADAHSGFAPAFVQAMGVGPVLVSRSDDKDFSLRQMRELSRYLCHLMDQWSEFTGATRAQALTPAAFLQFGAQHAPPEHIS